MGLGIMMRDEKLLEMWIFSRNIFSADITKHHCLILLLIEVRIYLIYKLRGHSINLMSLRKGGTICIITNVIVINVRLYLAPHLTFTHREKNY